MGVAGEAKAARPSILESYRVPVGQSADFKVL
jgi:hypothetical protein